MTKLKIAIPIIHNSRLRQIAKTKHDITLIDNGTTVSYNNIFDDKEKDNWNTISNEEYLNTASKFDILFISSNNNFVTYKNTNVLKAYGWTNVCKIFPSIIKTIGNNPLIICTSNNWNLRPQDRTVTIGIDEKEFEPREYDRTPICKILCPLNNYFVVGKVFANDSNPNKRVWWEGMSVKNYFEQLVGYDWRDIILHSNYIKITGFNPKLNEDYNINTVIPREVFRKWLKQYSSVLVPSSFKHQSNLTAETMMSKQVVITRPTVPFKINPSPLINNYNAIIIPTQNDLMKLGRNDFLTDTKKQKAIGENALLTAQQHFNMKTCINRWEEFFEHVVNWK